MRTGGTSQWLIGGTTVSLGVAVALLMGEVTVRMLEPREDTRSISLPESDRIYGLLPRSTGYAGGIEYRTNSWGFRGRDADEIDRDKDTVVFVLGDSYAFGYGVQATEAFPSVLEEALRSAYPHRATKVMTLALPGYNTAQYLAALKEFGPVLKPALVLLAYHLNDIERHARADNGAPDRLQNRSPKDYIHLLRFILPRLAAVARTLRISVTTTVTGEVSEYVENGEAWRRNQIALADLVAATTALKAKAAVVILPYMVQLDERHPALPAYREAQRFFESLQVPAVNAFDYFTGEAAGRLWINPFDGHPNARGHHLIAKAAADLIVTHHLIE